MSTLPASRDFVTRLLTSLPTLAQHNAGSNSLSNAPDLVKKQLLSLQVLFPNEFLPALDLLDRRLITRFRIGSEESPSLPISSPTNNAESATADVLMHDNNELLRPIMDHSPYQNTSSTTDTVHYVRSAHQRSSRYGTSYDSTTSYEVRLCAWNCTCPAFAFAAFPSVHPEPSVPAYVPAPSIAGPMDLLGDHTHTEAEQAAVAGWRFGGVSLGDEMPPVCKHLLACVLAEKCSGVFGACVHERRVSVETAAGWAAGWGDL